MSFRAFQKLVKNGNSTQVTIPRVVLFYLGWLPGSPIILEVTEDKQLIVRKPVEADFGPQHMQPIVQQVIEKMRS